MSDENNETTPFGDPLGNRPLDPLGIMDWVIGGKYKIRAYIGGGGFGEVYEGYNVNLPEQKLVIKFFKRVQSRDKFAKEAKILCLLDHPNISRIIDFLPEEGAVVVAYIDGQDGGVILKESGALREELFLKVARAMTGAIAYAHEKKIAHRDIKPSNILIDRNDNVFLIDFGIAKEMGTDATKTAYQALTPMFAAPERQTGEKDYNPFLSDIYETGITLFNFATNDMPYRNPVSPNIDEWGGKSSRILSPQLRRILKKATHPSPKKRYKTARELADEFKQLEQTYHHPRAFPVSLAAAFVVIALAAAVYFNWGTVKNLWTDLFPVETADQKALVEPERDSRLTEETRPDTIREAEVENKPPAVPPKDTEPVKKPETKPPESKPEVKPKEDTAAPATVTPKPEETEPAPPPTTRYLVQVTPAENATVKLDGKNIRLGQPVEIEPGRHELIVISPDYPIYRSTVRVAGESDNVKIDLAREYADISEINFQLALIPPSDQHILELTLNGVKKTIMSFPVLDFKKLPGEWEIVTNIIPLGDQRSFRPVIDSCVTFPYGGGPRSVLRSNRGIIEIFSDGQEQVPLVIFWTQE
ncbi:MAG: protein kinase [candidate division Zixibacteria bacterium]|nr:protein kinase [candidate division Zixibacteria bacterium]